MPTNKAIYCIFLLFIWVKKANSVAWLRKKGEIISIHELALQNQTSTNLYDANSLSGVNITGFDYKLYGEYGATDKLTIGVNSIAEIYSINSHGNNLLSGIAVKLSEYFARYGIFNNKNRSLVVAGQILYKPPSFYDTKHPQNSAIYGGTDQQDLEVMSQLLINLNPDESFFGFYTEYKQLLNIDFGYRERFNLNFNEVRLNIQYMFWFNEVHAILLGFYKTMRVYKNVNYGNPLTSFNYASWTANDQNSIEVSWVMFYEEQRAMSFGIYADVYGLPFGNGEANLFTIGIKCGLWLL